MSMLSEEAKRELREMFPDRKGPMPESYLRALNRLGHVGATREEIERIWNLVLASRR